MTTKRFFFVMVGAVILLCLLILASVFFANKLLQTEANKLSDLRAQNQVVEDQRIALIQANKDIEKYEELDSISRSIVPQDKDQARTVREINSIAADSGIQLANITFTASNLGQQAAQPSQNQNNNTGSAGSSSSGSNQNGSAQPAQPNQGQNQSGISQVTPVEGIPGVYALQLTISPATDSPVSYEQFLKFLERLENNRRTAHVDKISVNPIENSNGVTFTLTLNVYLKP